MIQLQKDGTLKDYKMILIVQENSYKIGKVFNTEDEARDAMNGYKTKEFEEYYR